MKKRDRTLNRDFASYELTAAALVTELEIILSHDSACQTGLHVQSLRLSHTDRKSSSYIFDLL